jgi:hypothetical protein
LALAVTPQIATTLLKDGEVALLGQSEKARCSVRRT